MPINVEFWALQTVAMLVTAFMLPGLRVSGPVPAFLTVLILALLNTYVWDTALFFAVPNELSLQTISLLVVNGTLFWIVVKILPGIEIEGVFPAIAAPIVFTILSILIQRYAREIDWHSVYRDIVRFLGDLKGNFQQPSSAVSRTFPATHLRSV